MGKRALTIPSFISSDHAKIFRLRLGTFSDTSRNPAFELVWAADTAIPLFQLNGQPNGVANTVSTPYNGHISIRRNRAHLMINETRTGGTNARLDRPQTLSIGLTTLKPGIVQLLPDSRQIILHRAEHVDPLSTRDLEIQNHTHKYDTNTKIECSRTFVYRLYFFATCPIAIKPSGVISPAAIRGTTLNVPFR